MKKTLSKLCRPLIDYPALYFLLLYTWGIVMVLVGIISSLMLLLTFHRPHRFCRTWYFMVGKGWGGVSLGCMFIMAKDMDEGYILHVQRHEYGHTFQNAVLGPLFPFMVAIPSMIRYHYQNWRRRKGLPNTTYDSIWFEGSATKIGETAWNKQLSKSN